MSIKSLFISAILAGAASAGNYDSNWDGWSSDSNQKNNGGYTATSADNSYTTTSPKGNSDNSWNSWNSQQSWGSATTVTVTATETVATNVAAQSTGGWDMWSPSPTCDCTSQESSSWGSKPGEMIIQVVDVGNANGSLTYWPEQVVAPVGSVVQFRFHPKVCLMRLKCSIKLILFRITLSLNQALLHHVNLLLPISHHQLTQVKGPASSQLLEWKPQLLSITF